MNVGCGLLNLWLIYVIIIIYAWGLMMIGNKIRGVKIENPEDHHNPKTIIIHVFPLLAFLVISILTPIALGCLFWIGSILIVVAGVIYALSITAFVRAKKGLTTLGVYGVCRNPMYVAWFLAFCGFSFMAWQSEPKMGIISACITLINALMIHHMVLGEEHFLHTKYGDAYHDYFKKTPRYLGILKNRERNK